MMNDRELADKVQRFLLGDPVCGGFSPDEWQQIIAALRRSQPEGMMLVPIARLGQGLSCPRPQIMGAHACKDRTQCWEPCGDLGQHEEYARPAPGASDE